MLTIISDFCFDVCCDPYWIVITAWLSFIYLFFIEIFYLLPCHVLNTENTDISIMSKMNTVGAGVRAGSILRRLMRQGGMVRTEEPLTLGCSTARQPWVFDLWVDDSHHQSSYFEGNGAASNGTLGDWRVEAFKWSDEIGLCRVACVKSTMISTLLTGTQMKIKTAIAVTSLHSLKHTWKSSEWVCAVMRGPAFPSAKSMWPCWGGLWSIIYWQTPGWGSHLLLTTPLMWDTDTK